MSMQIENESGDKKYFTIIPNYILNHSTATDQALYMQMKRIAGDNGNCKAGVRYFMKQLKVGQKTIKKSLEYLIKHKWITFIGTQKVERKRGHKEINVYKVNDIWKENIEYYDDCVSKQARSETHCVSSRNSLRIQQELTAYPDEYIRRTIKKEQKKKNDFSSKDNVKKNPNSPYKKKPYYDNQEMRQTKKDGKWWVLPDNGGAWLEYAGLENEIEWR